MTEATITSKGQVTIPKKIREKMKLHAGDKVIFQTDAAGDLKIKKSTVSIKDRAGSLKKYGRSKSVSIEEMNKAIKQKAVELDKKTRWIDTNILVRMHVEDDADQYQKAKNLIEKCTTTDPLFISHVVLVEWCWVLQSSYHVPKEKIIEEIE